MLFISTTCCARIILREYCSMFCLVEAIWSTNFALSCKDNVRSTGSHSMRFIDNYKDCMKYAKITGGSTLNSGTSCRRARSASRQRLNYRTLSSVNAFLTTENINNTSQLVLIVTQNYLSIFLYEFLKLFVSKVLQK